MKSWVIPFSVGVNVLPIGQILTWDIWFQPVQVFFMEKIPQIHHILKEEKF
jgi:hypothetical protein